MGYEGLGICVGDVGHENYGAHRGLARSQKEFAILLCDCGCQLGALQCEYGFELLRKVGKDLDGLSMLDRVMKILGRDDDAVLSGRKS